jgi:hypothetical protein
MRGYRTSAGTDTRLIYGDELVEGLKGFPETASLAADLEALNDELEAAQQARRAKRRPLAKARVALRFANYFTDQTIRSCSKAAEIADGARRGPVFNAVFPDGVGPVVAPAGSRQITPTQDLLNRLTTSKNAAVIEFAKEWKPKLEAALKKLQDAAAAHKTATKADGDAFLEELALREQHAHTVDRLMGQVRSAFPRDRAKQDLVFPVVDEGGSAASAPEASTAEAPAAGVADAGAAEENAPR